MAESADDVLLETEEKMEGAVDHLRTEFRGMRTGRAHPGLIEHIKVDYYGSQTPLQQLANIGVPEPQLLAIKPFDPSSIGDVEKAILKSDVGLTPQNDGHIIRCAVPPLSEERRKKLVSRAKDISEQARVAIRNVRREGNRQADGLIDDGLPEDAGKKLKDEIQDLTKKYEGAVNDLLEGKTKELLET